MCKSTGATNWTTNAVDGSEDAHDSPKILLVGKECREWREQHVKSDQPDTIKYLMRTFTASEGVKRPDHGEPKDPDVEAIDMSDWDDEELPFDTFVPDSLYDHIVNID